MRELDPEKSGKFLRSGSRPPTQDVVVFVDANKDDIVEGRKVGGWLICRVLQVAPSTYYAARDRAPSARAPSDAVIGAELFDLWMKNRKVYGGQETLEGSKKLRDGYRAGSNNQAHALPRY